MDFLNSLTAQIAHLFNKEDSASIGQLSTQLFHRILRNEAARLDFLTQLMMATAAMMFFSLTFLGFRASYGRYSPDSFLAKVNY
jgi:hypothetical protein